MPSKSSKDKLSCNSATIMSTVIMDLEISGCEQIFKYLLQLVVDFPLLWPGCYRNALETPKKNFAFLQDCATNDSIDKRCADRDVDSNKQSYTEPNACVKITKAEVSQDKLI